MSFKLLAIRPLKDCNEKYLKILQENRIYKFYNDYIFLDKEGNEILDFYKYKSVDKIQNRHSISESFFLQNDDNIKINVSAIVGKNGSGKSSLVELLITIINNISFIYGFQINFSGFDDLIKLIHIDNIKAQIFYENDGSFYCIKLDSSDENKGKISWSIVGEKKRVLESYYDNNDLDNFRKFIKESFFHTQIVNYSLWSYNDSKLELGKFINNLFHKNDAYQIPIVINPYREQGGTISPTRETELAMDRLLSNILQPNVNSLQITETYSVETISLKLKKKEEFNFSYRQSPKNNNDNPKLIYYKEIDSNISGQKDIILDKLYSIYGLEFDENDKENILNEYLIYKIIKICVRYLEYNSYFDRYHVKFYHNRLEDLIKKIFNDKSHITFKIRQVINFLKYKDVLKIDFTTQKIDISQYSQNIQKILNQNEDLSIVEFIPPSFFYIEIILENGIKLTSLSSGERQQISVINTIVYHIYNLFSVEKKSDKVKYKNFNIILEEIELYFHPEYQRVFVKKLIDSISYMKIKNVSINICFVTHSPFILSDIPDSNVLLLNVVEHNIIDNGEVMKKKISENQISKNKIFGNNIHELLTDEFFMSNTKGAFVIYKISKILDFYQRVVIAKENEFQDLVIEFNLFKSDFQKTIELLGEEYLKKILENHIKEIESALGIDEKIEYKDFLINRQIELENELQHIKKKLSNDQN